MEPQNPAPEPAKAKRSKLPLAIIILIIIGAAGYYAVKNGTFAAKVPGPVQEIIDATDKFISQLPELNQQVLEIQPKSRKVRSADHSAFQYSKALGYQFKTPFGAGTISATSSGHEFVKELEYQNGKKIIVSCLATTPRTEFAAPGSNAFFASQREKDAFLEYTGDYLDSGYDFTQLLLSVDPDKMRRVRTETEAIGYSKLISMKAFSLSTTDPVYRFEFNSLRGYQFGDYDKPATVHVALFPKADTKCDIYAHESQGLTQDDVDLMISTFGPAQ